MANPDRRMLHFCTLVCAGYEPVITMQAATLTTAPRTFTGQERDSESGLDYFGARYYALTLGRFMVPDPAGMMAADISVPQSLNRYAYVQNNPLSFVDPSGLDCVYLNDSGTGVAKGGVDQSSSSKECGKTGGYWVDGSVANVTIGGDAETVTLTGNTSGIPNNNDAPVTYQQNAVIDVGDFHNSFVNSYNHIALGVHGQTLFGQNPKSDAQYAWAVELHGLEAVIPGAIKPQVGGQLLRMIHLPATGMQAQMLQNGITQSRKNPPPYTVLGQNGCDCATWAQQMLGDVGINSGPSEPWPDALMDQIHMANPQAPQQ